LKKLRSLLAKGLPDAVAGYPADLPVGPCRGADSEEHGRARGR
jgi:hypothetical protein